MDVTKPNEVADLFVDLCSRLRALGATRVEAYGCFAAFAPAEKAGPVDVPVVREVPREPEEPIGPEARELMQRAKYFAAGGAGAR